MPDLHSANTIRIEPKALLENTTTLRTLNAFAIDVIAIPNVTDLFWYVAQNVVGKLNFVDCVIYQANEEQTELTQVAALGEKNPYGRTILNPLKIPFGEGITGQVAKTRQPVVVDDLLRDQNYIHDTMAARSEICVPLISGGRVVGVIDSEHPRINAFGPAELEVLQTVAAMTTAKFDLLNEVELSNQRYRELVQSHALLTQETDNRKALETELCNARRLEGIGRLTGRFAHDFNNLLTVISGNLELVEAELENPHAIKGLADAKTAADRGAKVIRDMLAFSQRTRLDEKPTDLNRLVSAVFDLNDQAEDAPVELQLADALWQVQVDRMATEVALLNLSINARDSMPVGGLLKITTENLTLSMPDCKSKGLEVLPGDYVRVSITDEGTGIPAAALEQIFDPFFTTKPVGAGKGLGLSTVMGFMRQSGGAVVARMNDSKGMTFELYFPALTGGDLGTDT